MKSLFPNKKCSVVIAVITLVYLIAALPALSLTTRNDESQAPDIVMEWHETMLNMIKADNIPNHFSNRMLAMVHIAMFDSINGISKKYTHFLVYDPQPWLKMPELAAATAAYNVLINMYPGKKAMFEELYEEQVSKIINNISNRPLARFGEVRYGEKIAQAVLMWRQNDGAMNAASVPYPDGVEIGQWRRSGEMPPMLPGWGQVMPFAMTSVDQFRLIGPRSMNGYEYARDYNEVKVIGSKNGSPRTEEQTTIARFWLTGIPHMWNLIARSLVEHYQYDLLESARLLALLNVTLADNNIACWNMKYHYGYWRPTTAIHYGDFDGNDNTIGDPQWESLIPIPPFPEYVSGHSTTCGSAATLLAKFAGTDSFTFTLASEANPNLPPRTFNSFWEAACEAGISRIYGGLHFNFSNVEGLETGRSLGRYVFENFMKPLYK